MSEDNAGTAAIVPGYAGHGDAPARRKSDQQLRAFVGEKLVELGDRLQIGELAGRLEALVARCEFGDQHVIRAIEDDRFAEPEAAAEVEARDRSVAETAARCPSTPLEELAGLLEALERTFDERAAAIAGWLKR